MGFLDNITKSVSQGIDRAKFEAEKIARIARVQGEIAEVRRQMDAKRLELADRAYDLYKAGQITSPTISALAQEVDSMRSSVIVKEDELKVAQSDAYIEPAPAPSSYSSQSVPVSYDTATSSSSGVAADKKPCPSCGFVMPRSAMFCPNCGSRLAS